MKWSVLVPLVIPSPLCCYKLVTYFLKAVGWNQFCWILKHFFFFFAYFSSPCFGPWKAEGEMRQPPSTPPPRVHQLLAETASFSQGLACWGGGVRRGCGCLAKVAMKLIFFFSKPPAGLRLENPINAQSWLLESLLWSFLRCSGSALLKRKQDTPLNWACSSISCMLWGPLTSLSFYFSWMKWAQEAYLERLPTLYTWPVGKDLEPCWHIEKYELLVSYYQKSLSSAAGKIKCAYVYLIRKKKKIVKICTSTFWKPLYVTDVKQRSKDSNESSTGIKQ